MSLDEKDMGYAGAMPLVGGNSHLFASAEFTSL